MSKIVKIENFEKSQGKIMTSLVVTTPTHIFVCRAMVEQSNITRRVWDEEDNMLIEDKNFALVSAINVNSCVPAISLDWSRIQQKYVWSVVV